MMGWIANMADWQFLGISTTLLLFTMSSRHMRVFFTLCLLCLVAAYLYHFAVLEGVHSHPHVSQIGPLEYNQEGHTTVALPVTQIPPSSSEYTSSPKTTSGLAPSAGTVSRPASEPRPASADETHEALPVTSVVPDDILLIIKTGASTVWRRMPLHFTTTLSNSRVPNCVVYSDLDEQLFSSFTTIDVLANETSHIQRYDPTAYKVYEDQKSSLHINTFREHALLPGDEPDRQESTGISPGWYLDKYKFLPMLRHAQMNWPGLKWYIYIEDDTFIFLPNILRYLATLSPDSSPSYYGAYSGPQNHIFAQGGSGIIFSRSLVRSVFSGSKIPSLETYGNETAAACCGDIVLGKVLRDHHIALNEGNYGTFSFRPEPPWKTGFDEVMWCEKVFTFHHIHGRDRVVLDRMEKRYEDAGRSIMFRDIFAELISPHLQQPMRSNWDNLASKWVINSSTSLAELPSDMGPSAFENATQTPELCQNACRVLPNCMSWRHEETIENLCALDTLVKLGRETDPLPTWKEKVVVTSGWMLERIEVLVEQECKGSEFS